MPGRVLVITYFFPPVGGVGAQRTLKYATYLPRFGWEPIIVTPDDPGYPLRDHSLMQEVPGDLEVHRSLSLEPARLAQALARRVRPGPRTDGIDRQARSSTPDTAEPRSGRGGGPGRSLLGTLRDRGLRGGARLWSRVWAALLFPDETVAWLPFGLLSAVRLARKQSVDVLYSSSPPVSAHLMAAIVKAATGRPWVADFRDPWVGNPLAHARSALRRRLEAATERWIVSHADRVVLAMEELRVQFAERYPDRSASFVHIPNGYDRSDLEQLPATQRRSDSAFRMTYAGSLYRQGELDVFLSGVTRLLSRRPDLRSRLRIDFIGRLNEANARLAAVATQPGRLGEVVRFQGFVPRREALAAMAASDALLQLMPAEPGAGMFVGGKLLEYLMFDRPILAMMPPGEGRALVDSLTNGRTVDVDPDAVAAAIEQLVDDPPSPAPADPEGRYDRVTLAGALARLLEDVGRSARRRP